MQQLTHSRGPPFVDFAIIPHFYINIISHFYITAVSHFCIKPQLYST